MTETLHLRRMRVRYRVRDDDPARRRRLDAVLERVLDEELDSALARAGVPRDEEICLRSLRVPVRLRLDGGEASAAAAWSSVLAAAIASALTAGPGPDIVRYSSRRAALVDVALGVAAGRLERAWAWRQLDLWRGADVAVDRGAAAELLKTLAGEPESIVPALAAVAAAGTLPRLVSRLEPAAWVELARNALAAAGASPTWLDAAAAPRPRAPRRRAVDAALATDDPSSVDLRVGIASAWRLSSIARAAAPALRTKTAGSERAIALAVLAWLEASPDIAPRLTEEYVRALAAEIAHARADGPPSPETSPPEADPTPAEAEAEAEGTLPAVADEPDRRWKTSFGGLLFLLGVLDDLGVPHEVTRSGPLERRPLRWTLHRLALTLVPADARDPAALAFAGLPPDAEPPEDRGEPWGDAELDALAELRERIEAHLRQRLDRPQAPTGELLDFVCRRRGEIVFDPGWIEVRLALEEVSPDLRRAGLDLDPGSLPWLGAVVRFVYG